VRSLVSAARLVLPEIKFCGMGRVEDVDAAVELGARYVGVVFAEGPRRVTVDRARELLRKVPATVGRVGVFGRETAFDEVAETARAARLDVVQLHGDPDEALVAAMRESFDGRLWAVIRVRGDTLPDRAGELFRVADAVVIDAYSPTALGGTGQALPWEALSDAVSAIRRPGRLVLAGGLRPETVATAVRALEPDVVDVSSGVESRPGVKDHAKLRAFRDAVVGDGGGG
jgi:phosphoribosylanthranilate isomerase